jgi:hypothetical protein
MSFVPIDPVEHTDNVTITTFNELKTGVDAIFTILGTTAVNYPAIGNYEFGPNNPDNDQSLLTFIHTNRYLLYEGDGTIIDPSGVGADVAISDPDVTAEVGEYDMDSVDWLTYGMQYRVSGVEWAMEYEKGGYII